MWEWLKVISWCYQQQFNSRLFCRSRWGFGGVTPNFHSKCGKMWKLGLQAVTLSVELNHSHLTGLEVFNDTYLFVWVGLYLNSLLKRVFLFNLLLRCNNQNHLNQTIKTVFHVQTHHPHKVVTSLFGHIQKALSVAASRTCGKHPRLSSPVREWVKNPPQKIMRWIYHATADVGLHLRMGPVWRPLAGWRAGCAG